MNSSADKNPLVSAVVFAYRNLDEFEYTVQSILGQDYPEIELLISTTAARILLSTKRRS